MSLLLYLTLRGSLIFAIVAACDALLAARTSTRTRRYWWLLVPLAFLLVGPLWKLLPATVSIQLGRVELSDRISAVARSSAAYVQSAGPAGVVDLPLPLLLAAAGSIAYAGTALARTRAALRRWGRGRFSTDAELLSLLEDCRAVAGITDPVGLVVSTEVPSPMVLGCLRPRILLPAELVATMSREQLRGVLLHELAHIRAGDLLANWLFTLVLAVHWFNPAAHLAFRAWKRFCEEAADESAITWLGRSSARAFGETLLHVLRHTPSQASPFAALAIVESVSHLKKRLTMIKHYENKAPQYLFTGLLIACLALGILQRPMQAADGSDDPKTVANGTMQTWLKEIDQSKYAQSWTDAAPAFQQAITSEAWVADLTRVRTPLGACKSRVLGSASRQTDLPSPAGKASGDFILAQFDSSFDGLKYAVETVSFVKAPDGTWKAAGYYIKPKV